MKRKHIDFFCGIAARFIPFLGIATVLLCSATATPATATLRQDGPDPENVAVRILKLEATVKPVTPEMFKTLNEVIDKSCTQIRRLPRRKPGAWDPAYARSVFACIDNTMSDKGFIYPDSGFISYLADTLAPYKMPKERRASFEAHPSNQRHIKMIKKRFPGPFYVADCDTASFIYLGVADRLGLPIHLVDLPEFNRNIGHNFVRWREGSHVINWETMCGEVKPNEYYLSGWRLPRAQIEAGAAFTDLTIDQTLGYKYGGVATEYARRGEYEKALAALDTALRLYPQNVVANNNFAWYTAVAPRVDKRNHPLAIFRAQFVLRLVNDPNVRDTLAAVYASAGVFKRAIEEQQLVLQTNTSSEYRERLKMYEKHQVFREARATSDPGTIFQP